MCGRKATGLQIPPPRGSEGPGFFDVETSDVGPWSQKRGAHSGPGDSTALQEAYSNGPETVVGFRSAHVHACHSELGWQGRPAAERMSARGMRGEGGRRGVSGAGQHGTPDWATKRCLISFQQRVCSAGPKAVGSRGALVDSGVRNLLGKPRGWGRSCVTERGTEQDSRGRSHGGGGGVGWWCTCSRCCGQTPLPVTVLESPRREAASGGLRAAAGGVSQAT